MREEDIVPMKGNKTLKTIRQLSRIAYRAANRLIELKEDMRRNFGSLLDEEKEENETGKDETKEDNNENVVENVGDAEIPEDYPSSSGEGNSEGPSSGLADDEGGTDDESGADDEGDDTENDDPNIQDKKEDGSGKGPGAPQRTIISTLFEMGNRETETIMKIMDYCQEFDTKLSAKKNTKVNELATSLEILPSFGNDMSNIDMSELALLDRPETEMIFYSKLAEHSLGIRVPIDNKRLPVAMCIDSSGSMSGEPYTMACGFVISMLKKLQQDKRGGAFIMFSDRVTHAITVTPEHGFSLKRILSILLTPHFGGTNFDAALQYAYNVKAKENWKNMTTLLITDGGDSISDQTFNHIKSKKTKLDHISCVLVHGSDSGLRGLNDDSIKVSRKNMFVQLTKIGNAIL